jgi:hypothetical protein
MMWTIFVVGDSKMMFSLRYVTFASVLYYTSRHGDFFLSHINHEVDDESTWKNDLEQVPVVRTTCLFLVKVVKRCELYLLLSEIQRWHFLCSSSSFCCFGASTDRPVGSGRPAYFKWILSFLTSRVYVCQHLCSLRTTILDSFLVRLYCWTRRDGPNNDGTRVVNTIELNTFSCPPPSDDGDLLLCGDSPPLPRSDW